MTVYLIHLDRPLSRGISRSGTPLIAGHYIGYAEDLINRIDEHVMTTWEPLDTPVVLDGKKRRGEKHGPDATFMGFVNFMKVGWRLARTWDGADQRFEKMLKKRKGAPRLCPYCNPRALELAKEYSS